MQPRFIEIEISEALAGYMPPDDHIVRARLKRYLLIDMVKQGVISWGKAAELAGVDKMTFITDMGSMGIPYFDGSIDEVLADVESIRRLSEGSKA